MLNSEFVALIQRRLRDDTGRQWSSEYVVDAINAAFSALCHVIPQAYTEHRNLVLEEGTEQQIDSDLHRIVHMLHNVCPITGDEKRSVIYADLSIMDKVAPHWRQDDPRGYVIHYLLNPIDESKFYVWPPIGDSRGDPPVVPAEPTAPIDPGPVDPGDPGDVAPNGYTVARSVVAGDTVTDNRTPLNWNFGNAPDSSDNPASNWLYVDRPYVSGETFDLELTYVPVTPVAAESRIVLLFSSGDAVEILSPSSPTNPLWLGGNNGYVETGHALLGDVWRITVLGATQGRASMDNGTLNYREPILPVTQQDVDDYNAALEQYQLELDAYNAAVAALEEWNALSDTVIRGVFTKTPCLLNLTEGVREVPDEPLLPVLSGNTQSEIDQYEIDLANYNSELEIRNEIIEINSLISSGNLTLALDFPFDKAHELAVQEFALYYSLVRDDEQTSNTGRAQRHWNNFFQLLNKREATELLVKAAEEESE